ncbi:type IV pilin [Anaerosalibacter sp. Marseille-P3206]|uniref:type IV pilin n=1 Tax=Anaerosalibacter sp. Marseille-P3206 TaxID=1871005 RepID=UPI000985CBBE|nr:type IV pilin [Anaerosalibacter sp. Marseille-P3206]
MKKFSEVLKDFFYDAIDYILMVVIIVIVAGIIGWRLNVLFDKDKTKTPTVGNEIEISKDEKNIDNKDGKDNDKNQDKKSEESSKEVVKIVIPSGSPASSIADILFKEKLIEDEKQFISKMIELKLDTKVKCGEFEIKRGSSIEEILATITK